jgi:peptidoglycan/xylan/chitin deacetylase (PgdA/CDA1 family)
MVVWSALSRLAPGMVPQGVILLYHRVAEVAHDPQLLCVTPENFVSQMEVIRSRYRPCSLRSLAGRVLQPPGSVAVTFDDGYADNLIYAKPILQKLQVPATVFVSSGFIGTGEMPYWDELDHLLLRAPRLPRRLALDHGDAARTWEFGEEPPAGPGWNVLQPCTLQRQQAYVALCDHLRQASPERRGRVLALSLIHI